MYAKNPGYFTNPQTSFGVRRMGPIEVPGMLAQGNASKMGTLSADGQVIPPQWMQAEYNSKLARYQPLGRLSSDGRLMPAPLGAIQMGGYGGFFEDNKETIKNVAIYGLGGFALGYLALLGYRRFM